MLDWAVRAFPGRDAADPLDGTKDLSTALLREMSIASEDRFHFPFLLVGNFRASPFSTYSLIQNAVL